MTRTVPDHNDRGATALIIAMTMVLLMGIAAIAIDLGLGFNERRQDQIAADVGAMGGAVDFLTANGNDEMSSAALEYTWRNLPSVTAASWDVDTAFRDAFRACTDPEAATFGLGFQSLSEPDNTASGGVWNGSTNLPCLSVSPLGFFRVKVPDQFVDTAFGRVIGFDQITTGADAIATITPRGSSGILPFGLPVGTPSGEMICLSDSSGGNAQPPCDGPSAGNFGTLKGRQFGNPLIGTTQNCTASPLGDTLAVNIAVGLDHLVTLAPSTSGSDEIRDECFNFGVNTLNTDTGFPNNGAEDGLVGPLPGMAPPGAVPRLLSSTNTVNLFGVAIDNTPLWGFISASADGCYPTCLAGNSSNTPNVPETCDPQTFDNSISGYLPPAGWPGIADDWNDDGEVDAMQSWEHMEYCLKEYVSGSYVVLFTEALGEETRFAYTPQFFEANLGNGNDWLHVQRFTAVWLQGTYWKRGNNWSEHHPGEPCDTSGGGSCAANEDMKQLTAFTLPDLALPVDLRGDPPPWGSGLNPFDITLYK